MTLFVCSKCGENVFQVGNRGAYLTRVNSKEEDAVWECRPSCEHRGTNDEAVIMAIEDTE